MRLHRLEITAFGPFAETVEIDLDELSGAGLFLLTGATGAGKTSVLDAVCFALYGDVPGDRGSARRLRSDQAPPGVRPRVELELTVSGRRLRLVRSPSWERDKLRGTGTTTEQASVVVSEQIVAEHETTWRTLSTRLDETGHLISRLLGMNLTQFTQVAMLPQGRFQAFLRARSDERHALLQQLFRTGRFEDVEGWLREHRKALRAESHRLQEQVADLTSRISETALAEPPDSETWEATLGEWAAGTRTGTALELTEATESLAAALAHEQEARSRLEEGAARHERHQRLERARQERAALLARADEHEAEVAALAAARRSVPVAMAARREVDLAEAVAATRRRLETRPTPAEDDPEALAALEERLLVTAGSVAEALPRLARLSAAEAGLPALTSARDAARERVTHLEAEAATLPRRARLAAERVAELRTLALALPAHRAALEVLTERRAAAVEARSVSASLDAARAEHLEARERAVLSHEALLTVREARIASMASELAGVLAVGACCPVCGSANHPAKAQPGPGASDAAAERDAQRRLDDDKSDEHARAMHVRDLETRIALLLERAAGVDLEATAGEVEALRARCEEAESASTDLAVATREVQSLEEQRERSEVLIEQARHQAAAAHEERLGVLREIERLGADLDAVAAAARRVLAGEDPATDQPDTLELPFEPRPDLTALHEALRRRTSEVRARLTALREHELAVQAHQAAAAEAEAAAEEAGFTDVGSALACALAEAEQEQLTDRVERHRSRIAAVTEVLAEADENQPDGARPDPLPDLEVLAEAHHHADAVLVRARARAATLTDRCARLSSLVASLEELLEQWAPVRERLELATSVSAFVDGRSPDNALAMRLSAYVLAWRLSQVVQAANERLARMSDQRYSLEHTGRRGAGETRGGLSLLVRDDWSGESRDPVTLSGGETFVVSLALALGLADVISREAGGTELDTLFVDEGFGSLDSETLEDVMDTLDSLREGGRVVGVVSHVSEMRDRIPVQLHVAKGRAGSSVALRAQGA